MEYITEKIVAVSVVNEIIIVTNSKFFSHFYEWSKKTKCSKKITVLDDGTTSNDDRKGAIGDIQFVIDLLHIDEDILVIGGDNLFFYDLAALVKFQKEKNTAVVSLYDVKSMDLAKLYGIVSIDKHNKIIEFVEKPPIPKSTLAAICTYLYPKKILPLIKQYLDDGNQPDKPGSLVEWMYRKINVYGYVLSGKWFDIGSKQELDAVQKVNLEG